MNFLNVSTILGCVALLTSAPVYFASAVEPLSESDMGNMSIESGDVLSVMGATASGQVSIDKPKSDTDHDNVAYIETDQPIELQVDSTLVPSNINPEEMVSTFKISERSDGQLGASTIYVDEKDHNVSASQDNGVLTILQDVQVQRVHIHQPRHSPTSMPRGDHIISGIDVSSSISISGR